MTRINEVLDRQSRRVDGIIAAIDAGDTAKSDELVRRLAAVSPWELAAAGDAFVRDMIEAEDAADGVIE